jgi:hypothetical protein
MRGVAASLATDLYDGIISPTTPLPVNSLMRHSAEKQPLLPAFEAEGLLGLAVAMLPALPPLFLLRNWVRNNNLLLQYTYYIVLLFY